eukprot:gnl/TRDRNA2_/TRDRNA2_174522_c0_seq1.p1 gnl/TRDRNA2_/TRDRNA2_174522_c0~~gnl/TRDRNA2_/TRDRNA2_174522_c0_seq1.p1  ORF type:complete len:104 (-),score=4.15 gnl/TRDRNA2_/TRDRNA2_174522_c0_seq1:298-609(-)
MSNAVRRGRNWQEVNTMLVETIKESQQQYRQAGLSQGVARQWQQGVEKGATDVARSILQRQLQRRFGHVPPHIEAQLNAARLDELDQWIDRLFDSLTIGEVFR